MIDPLLQEIIDREWIRGIRNIVFGVAMGSVVYHLGSNGDWLGAAGWLLAAFVAAKSSARRSAELANRPISMAGSP